MLVLFAILVFVYNFAYALFLATGFELSPVVEFLYRAAFLCGAIWWLRADARRSAVKPLYCQGMLMGVGWFALIPYHLLKTRGAKGLLPLLLLAGSFVLARVAATMVYFFVFGFPPGY
jgi:hypothetical protein